MISRCCTPPNPDYQELSREESKRFCKQVYLLRKNGYSVADAQALSYRMVLEESISCVLGNEP
jgi:hypothetical protein